MNKPSEFLGKKILSVDDEPDLRFLVKELFEDMGATVFEAENSTVAIECIKNNAIDVVISDVRMPGGSGVELLQFLQSQPEPKPIVIMMSGYSDLTQETAVKMGAKTLLGKPYDFEKLLDAVTKGLASHPSIKCA
jgi:DNA-binding NtrC family response regulator